MDIPEFVEADISNLNLGDSFRVADLHADEKFVIKTNVDQIIASVTHPMKEEEITAEVSEEDGDFIDETSTEGETSEESEDSADNKKTEE